jgi:hypothetical protein
MAVSLRANFDANSIRQYLLQRQQVIEQAVLLRLQRVGESFITNARNNDTYKDRTGNLRNSIGYVVLKNGEQVAGGFPGSGEGVSTGEQVIEEISAKFPTGYVLIVVAGMDYAAAVESKGYDVLTSGSKIAVTDLKKSLQALKNKV